METAGSHRLSSVPPHPTPEQNSVPSDPAPSTARSACRTAARLILLARRLAALTEAELAARIRAMSDADAGRLYDLLRPRYCDCPIETERCTCLRDRWYKQLQTLSAAAVRERLRVASPAGVRLVGAILGRHRLEDTPRLRTELAGALLELPPLRIVASADAMTNGELRRLCKLFGASADPCDCPVQVKPCRHARQAPLFAWPPAVEAELLRRLAPGEHAGPPADAVGRPSRALHPIGLADLRKARHEAGLALWNGADRVHAPVDDAIIDRLVRDVSRRSNGSDIVGRVAAVSAAAPPPKAAGTAPAPCLPAGNGLTTFQEVHLARICHAGQLRLDDGQQDPGTQPP